MQVVIDVPDALMAIEDMDEKTAKEFATLHWASMSMGWDIILWTRDEETVGMIGLIAPESIDAYLERFGEDGEFVFWTDPNRNDTDEKVAESGESGE